MEHAYVSYHRQRRVFAIVQKWQEDTAGRVTNGRDSVYPLQIKDNQGTRKVADTAETLKGGIRQMALF
jgi:hypothetical protein